MLYFLWYVHCAGGLEPLIDTRNGGQDRKIKGGAYQLSLGLANRLSDVIVLNAPVAAIHQSDSLTTVTTVDKTQYKARRVIVAAPPHLIADMKFTPALPRKRDFLVHHMPPGLVQCSSVVVLNLASVDPSVSPPIVTLTAWGCGNNRSDGCIEAHNCLVFCCVCRPSHQDHHDIPEGVLAGRRTQWLDGGLQRACELYFRCLHVW